MDDLPRPSRHHAGCNNPYMDDFPRGNAKEEIVQRTPGWIDKAAQKYRNNPRKPSNPAGISEIEIGVDSPWMNMVRTQVNTRRGRAHANGPCTIFKVQENILQCNPDAYTPLVVSIGPYHHHQCSPRHRSRRGATELLDKCLLEMKSLDADVQTCYSEPLHRGFDAESLAMVMLLDGCFILHLLLKRQNLIDDVSNSDQDNDDDDDQVEDGEILLERGKRDKEMEEEPLLGTLWIWNFVLYDLLKLENQIPFFVLKTLFGLLKAPGDEDLDLVNLAFKLFSDIHPSNSQTRPVLPAADQVHHLLHLLHSTLVPSKNHHVLDITQAVKAPKRIPNATELQQAGVKFVKKINASSFLDISFHSNGTMEIPEICLYDHTNTLFRNLIAFEQCYPNTRTYITIYAAFMDRLIDTPKDVRLLHLNGILTNGLSTDEAAADLFNKLCYQIHYASDRNYLHELFVDVNKYYYSRWNQWRARLMRDYFSNPWTIISLMAAVLLLLLTVEQSFFSAYSYFRPS
ncbi:UPF0481 protein At3g47200-like isoform X2 [Dioscorea cayenensis subsp. rotundata]|uniref:UPF0481 protein At3g47200-like isoform X2 n=1 Tax=Dioscorea cayennensis subsp. rotundata TaxID=55577 RepID=A0AB40CIL5_DIOCR|nr:UPF0481 protein At3g47200-like isoform X2 [Dioscorea cayenensis subsp. rotundata]